MLKFALSMTKMTQMALSGNIKTECAPGATIGVVLRMLMVAAMTAMLLLTGGCRGSRHNVRNELPKNVTLHPGKLNNEQKRLSEEALSWIGTPYKYGASEKGKGTDCSGLVLKVYEQVLSKKLPRNSAKQAESCRKIKRGDVKVGDLVFFATGKDKGKISHVGIMLDKENFIHASTKSGVVVSNVGTPYYTRTFKMYGRVR